MLFASSDLHLGRSLCKGIQSLAMDYAVALKGLTKAILTYPCDGSGKVLILAGDIFDTPRCEGVPLQCFADFITELAENQVKVLFIQGNHDRQDPNNPDSVPLPLAVTPLRLRHMVTHLTREPIQVSGYTIAGLDYCAPEALKVALQTIPPCDILVLHQAFEEFLPFEGAFDVSSEDIPPQVGNVVVGDIHTAKCIKLGNGGQLLSPGSLHRCSVTEQGGSYWTHEGGQWVRGELPQRSLIKCSVKNMEELHDVEALINSQSRVLNMAPLVHLTYAPEMADMVKEWEVGKEMVLLKVKGSAEQVEEAPVKVKGEGRLTLLEALPFVLNVDTSPGLYRLCEEVLVNDPGMAVDSFVREQLKEKG